MPTGMPSLKPKHSADAGCAVWLNQAVKPQCANGYAGSSPVSSAANPTVGMTGAIT